MPRKKLPNVQRNQALPPRREDDRRVSSDEEIIAALVAARGVVKTAAEQLGRNEDAIYYAAAHSKAVQEAMTQIRVTWALEAEQAQLDLLKSPTEKIRQRASEFLLERIGKHLGYVLRQEMTGANGAPIDFRSVQAQLSQLSDDELEALSASLASTEGPARVPGTPHNTE